MCLFIEVDEKDDGGVRDFEKDDASTSEAIGAEEEAQRTDEDQGNEVLRVISSEQEMGRGMDVRGVDRSALVCWMLKPVGC